ncbi:hypothetical protein RJ639_044971 [Escallonia herrerae]|uniref:Large ribosomal RNA subunit accumulation protein YCED homolog 1, chloroplastic n=1 Tax=Escallonia herrerae TaxID=1293975 RepID=A0AA88WDU7_9ASTE|nr:hypothetical protein RJ639_044971 [Escallonia herrerae]
MTLLLSSFSLTPSFPVNRIKVHTLGRQRNFLSSRSCTSVYCNILLIPLFNEKKITVFMENKPPSTFKLTSLDCMNSRDEVFLEDNEVTDDWREQEEEGTQDVWEGAVVYQRNPLMSHIEYCTTLERLGLGKLATEVSKSRASLMGKRVTSAVKDFPLGTPVLISLDVIRKKQKLRLDGIIKTVITLGCNRCGELAAECVFSNFSLLLTEEPIEEPDIIDMGVVFGQDNLGTSSEDVDVEDWLYFPPQQKTIDISKPIRDMVHLEITINALCDPACKGLCLKCGMNLNTSSCKCSEEIAAEKSYGPLAGLRRQVQQN